MRRPLLPLACGLAALAAPGLAQDPHAGHVMSTPTPPPAQDPHAGHVMPTPAPTPTPPPAEDPHAGHVMPAEPDPHAGHVMPTPTPPPAQDPHAGHVMPTEADPHAGHAMPAAAEGTALPAGNAPPPPVPADHAADAIFGREAMAMSRHHLTEGHGGQTLSFVQASIFEARLGEGEPGYAFAIDGWVGGDIHRLVLKTEGEGRFGKGAEQIELQALYARAIDPYWNLQAGIRHDLRPTPSRTWASIGIEGLAPYWFDVEGTLFLSTKSEVMARLEGSYDQRLTQRWILQPRAELTLAAQDSRDIGLGAGLSEAEVGLRLRYDIRRDLAPYVGVEARRSFGATRRFAREAGEEAGGVGFVAGIRWGF